MKTIRTELNKLILNETWKPIAKKKVKYKDKTGTYNWEIESGIDTWAGDGNVPKIILHYQHFGEVSKEHPKGYPSSGGMTFWLKHKNGKPYTPQEAKALVNKISNKKIMDFQRKSQKPSGSGQHIYYVDGKFLREGKLTEGKYKFKGKYLHVAGGGLTSIPGPYENDALKVTVGRESFNIYQGRKGIIAIGDSYSKEFKNGNDLAKWLNKEKAKYVGIDRR